MRPRPENLEPAHVLGYLGSDNILYCSRACASSRGQAGAQPVDNDEFAALVDAGAVARSVVCPVCGSDYPTPLAGEDELRP
jgi:hypothetical protein